MRIHRRHARGRPPHPDVLTPAEWRVLEQLRERLSNAAIADRLGISVNTVRTHVSSMLAKLDLDHRAALARWDGKPAETSREAPRRVPALLAPFGWIRQSAATLAPPVKIAATSVATLAFAAVVWISFGSALDRSTTLGTTSPVSQSPSPDPELTATAQDNDDGFAIYLLQPPAPELQSLAPSDLAQLEPLLAQADVLTYSVDRHEIGLAPGVEQRLELLELPGKPFVVTVDGKPIYVGEFMALIFSRTSDGAVILWPAVEKEGTLRLQLGYPNPDFFTGLDPRSDSRILEVLDDAGKIR